MQRIARKDVVVPVDQAQRFERHVTKSDGCWIWTGTIHPRSGYGTFAFGGQHYRAHRVSYAIRHGLCPAGKLVLHSCDNRKCVNPDHLSLGTHADNARDARERGGVARGIETTRDGRVRRLERRLDDAIGYAGYLYANLCGLAKAVNVGPMPFDFEMWRKARYGLERDTAA